ncbi:MAG TPA: DUF1203 domain-containing protein [Steroidobacteraceae bacterium]|jgi:hypothetical protein
MNFRVSGLAVGQFAPLFGLPEEALSARGVVRRIADCTPGFPCRISLRDADVGESVLLLNYEHLPVHSPYRSSHAIFVREFAIEATPAINEIPPVLHKRLLSARGFDDAGMMIEADVVEGSRLRLILDRLFDDARIRYVHLHNAKPGCFAARVDRA